VSWRVAESGIEQMASRGRGFSRRQSHSDSSCPTRSASPPDLPSLTLLATCHFPHGQVASSRRARILTVEDKQIAKGPSADATNARHPENPVGPRCTRLTRPFAGLNRVSVGDEYLDMGSYRLFSCVSLFLFVVLRRWSVRPIDLVIVLHGASVPSRGIHRCGSTNVWFALLHRTEPS